MLDRSRLIRFLAFAFVAWIPPVVGMILAVSDSPAWLAVLASLLGILAAGAIAARMAWNPTGLKSTKVVDAQPVSWSDIANEEGQYVNRWSSYSDLFESLTAQTWIGAKVAEIGGTNAILRAMLHGATYEQLAYPEYDAQDLATVADASFNAVVLDQTLEHIPDPERAMREMHRILEVGGIAIVSTPFLVPVHNGEGYGDFYRWTPSGLKLMLDRCGFDADVRYWGNRNAAKVLLDDMYLKVAPGRRMGLSIEVSGNEPEFPVTVWAVARKRE